MPLLTSPRRAFPDMSNALRFSLLPPLLPAPCSHRYQSVTPHQDLVMRHACLTYLAGPGPQPPPRTSPRHACAQDASDSPGDEGHLVRLSPQEGADAEALQGAASLGRLHDGAGASSERHRRGQQRQPEDRRGKGGEGRQREGARESRGQRQRRRKLGALVVSTAPATVCSPG
eukprot:scaffold160710_cov14-Tisochrysis_lutea.AAC.2